jgi:hypothetical protein
MKEIKPCPFCHSTNIRYSSKTTGNNRRKIQRHLSMYCENCHCYGPRIIVTLEENETYKNINDEKYVNIAIDNWNNR